MTNVSADDGVIDPAYKVESENPAQPIAKPKLLFIGPLPPPVTGQSLACKVLFEETRNIFDVSLVDINKQDLNSGSFSFNRFTALFNNMKYIFHHVKHSDVVYFTITESILGNIKDLLIYALCRPRLKNMVVHLHGGAGMVRLLNGRLGILRVLNRFFLKRMAAVSVLGPRLRPIYEGIVENRKLRTVANFAQGEFFLDEVEIERKFSNQRLIKVAYLSNMIPEKGYLLMLQAYDELEPEMKANIRLDFAGGFPSKSEEQSFLARIENQPNVTYHGLVHGETKRQFLADAQILCLPTFYPYEGQPICILEAYAAGCAVITTDHSGILDVFENNKNGYLVEKRSVENLRELLVSLPAAHHHLKKFGLRNMREARERYTTTRYNRDLIEILAAASIQ